MYQLLLLKKECDHTMNQYNSEVSKDKGQSLGHLEYKAEKLNGLEQWYDDLGQTSCNIYAKSRFFSQHFSMLKSRLFFLDV